MSGIRLKPATCLAILGPVALLALFSGPARAGDFTDPKKLQALKAKIGAVDVPILDPCVDPGPKAEPCRRRALDRAKKAFLEAKTKPVRVLHLGDSHVAADLITGMTRDRLQTEYGGGGRGFIHVDQLVGYGGRRQTKGDGDWVRDRIVDAKEKAGRPYGFSGVALEPKKKGAKLTFSLTPEDTRVVIYYVPQAGAAEVVAKVGKAELGRFDPSQGQSVAFELPTGRGKKSELVLEAQGPKARIVGLSFESAPTGLFYDAIGPVGADARVYLDLGRDSLQAHLTAHDPALIVLMVGGNDALKSRKGWTNLEQVEKDHRELLAVLKQFAPNADCLLFGPMDAGDKVKGRVVSKALLVETRDLQKKLAEELGCGFWDTLEAMGGTGSITKWEKAKVMNGDLVHPKKPAGDLLGLLFAEAWLAGK